MTKPSVLSPLKRTRKNSPVETVNEKKMEEIEGRANEDGSVFQDTHAIDVMFKD